MTTPSGNRSHESIAAPVDNVPQPGPQPEPQTQPPVRRVRLAYLLGPLAAITICAQVGDALTTTLADTHPLALMALNARNRILVLVTNQLDAVSYYVVGTLRLLLSDPIYFLVGIFYGDVAMAWVKKRGESAQRIVGWLERNFNRTAWPFVLVAPNPIICMMAGYCRMRVRTFIALNVVGTIGRLFLIRQIGAALDEPIDDVLGFFAEHRLVLLGISVALVLVLSLRQRLKGTSEVAELAELAAEGES